MSYSSSELARNRALYESTGIHPIHKPCFDGHHTEVDFTEADKQVGDVCGFYMGDIFSDVDHESDFLFSGMTSQNTWERIARALRLHGLKIVDDPQNQEPRDRPDYFEDGKVVAL